MADQLGYRERPHTDERLANRWGIYNYDADRWMDVHFGSEAAARQAAAFLTKVRTPPPIVNG